MRTNKISLNIFLSCLKAQGLDVVFFYDRVKLYVDSATKKVNIERICPDVKRQKIIPRTLLHYDTMYLMIDARQPNNTYFERLKWMVEGHYVVNYAEFAMDIFCKDRIQVSKLRKLLNSVLVLERKRKKDAIFVFIIAMGKEKREKIKVRVKIPITLEADF